MKAAKTSLAMGIGMLVISSMLIYPFSKLWAQDGFGNSGPPSIVQIPIPIDDDLSIVIPIAKNLPSDPGEAGDSTIEGIDVDQDGVRDDVERDIVFAYPNKAKARAVLYLMAKQYQSLLVNRTNGSAVLNSYGYLEAYSPCLTAATGDSNDSESILRPLVLDTYERSVAYVAALRAINGILSIPSKSVTCP